MTDTTKTEPLGDWWNRPDEHLVQRISDGKTWEVSCASIDADEDGERRVVFETGIVWFSVYGRSQLGDYRIIRNPAPTADAAIERAVHDAVEQVGMLPVFAPAAAGMTLWDLFAAAASTRLSPREAVECADYMMAERAKRGVA